MILDVARNGIDLCVLNTTLISVPSCDERSRKVGISDPSQVLNTADVVFRFSGRKEDHYIVPNKPSDRC